MDQAGTGDQDALDGRGRPPWLRAALAAFSLLTIAPLPPGEWREEDLRASVRFFPLAGLLLGMAAAGVAAVVFTLLPPWPGSVLLVLAMTAFSGALHLDGLADSTDAMLSSRTRERMLEIMRDSHVGVMGVLAVAGVLLLQASGFAAIACVTPRRAVLAAVLAPLAGRMCMVVALYLQQPYARAQGLGKAYFTGRSPAEACVAGAGLLLAGLLLAGSHGLAAGGVALLAAAAFSLAARRALGGGTGDTAGAACVLAETFAVLGMASCLHLAGVTA